MPLSLSLSVCVCSSAWLMSIVRASFPAVLDPLGPLRQAPASDRGGHSVRRGRLPTRGPPQRGLHRLNRRFDRNNDGSHDHGLEESLSRRSYGRLACDSAVHIRSMNRSWQAHSPVDITTTTYLHHEQNIAPHFFSVKLSQSTWKSQCTLLTVSLTNDIMWNFDPGWVRREPPLPIPPLADFDPCRKSAQVARPFPALRRKNKGRFVSAPPPCSRPPIQRRFDRLRRIFHPSCVLCALRGSLDGHNTASPPPRDLVVGTYYYSSSSCRSRDRSPTSCPR